MIVFGMASHHQEIGSIVNFKNQWYTMIEDIVGSEWF